MVEQPNIVRTLQKSTWHVLLFTSILINIFLVDAYQVTSTTRRNIVYSQSTVDSLPRKVGFSTIPYADTSRLMVSLAHQFNRELVVAFDGIWPVYYGYFDIPYTSALANQAKATPFYLKKIAASRTLTFFINCSMVQVEVPPNYSIVWLRKVRNNITVILTEVEVRTH